MHMNCLASILAQATSGTSTGTPSALQGLLNSPIPMMVLFAIIFYFLLIRPQQKRAKEQRKMLEAIKSGDEVVTASGIIGTIVTVKDRKITLRSGDAKIEITKEAITAIVAPGNSQA